VPVRFKLCTLIFAFPIKLPLLLTIFPLSIPLILLVGPGIGLSMYLNSHCIALVFLPPLSFFAPLILL
jgi:hypothetical protein